MAGRECYHCKQWVDDKADHDCWTTTEEKLTQDLPEDLMDAWLRLRETASDFGEQRIYASHKSIMFSKKTCYFFVRPGPKYLELWFFLGRTEKHPFIRKSQASSRLKVAHMVRLIHRDEVEIPLTEWLREAYDVCDTLKAPKGARKAAPKAKKKAKAKKTKTKRKKK
jgi:hypothetical protein